MAKPLLNWGLGALPSAVRTFPHRICQRDSAPHRVCHHASQDVPSWTPVGRHEAKI